MFDAAEEKREWARGNFWERPWDLERAHGALVTLVADARQWGGWRQISSGRPIQYM